MYRNQSMEKNTVHVSGALLINKEAGVTSHDVVAQVRNIPALKGIKIGHSGTLDPFATGVLIVLLGYATRLQDELHLLPKTYWTRITLGATSSTDDVTGAVTPRENIPRPSEQEVLASLTHIQQQTSQIPPTYAAIKVGGKKLYEYARKGESVERKARPITIHAITLESYSYPNIEISVTCSTGTYIRSIARDIGDMLGTGAYCSMLTRAAIGSFRVENAHGVQELPHTIQTVVVPPEQLVSHISSVRLSDENVVKLKNGGEVKGVKSDNLHTSLALHTEKGMLFGIGKMNEDGSILLPAKILTR